MTTTKKIIYLLIFLALFLLLTYFLFTKFSGLSGAINDLTPQNINEQTQKAPEISEVVATTTTQPDFFSLKEEQAAVLEIADQQINGRSLSVSKVMTTADSWLAIYSNNAGQPGNLLGYQSVGVGTTENLIIELSPLPETTSLLGVLHTNLGTREKFEYPGGPDLIISKNGQPLIVPFSLIMEER